jgi:FkbM family methyltransferase
MSMIVNFPRLLTLSLERAGLRGAPTILGQLSKIQFLKDQVATVTLPAGQEISIPAYDGYWCRHLYAGTPYEPDVERAFRQLGMGRVLIDCGANIGYWSARHKDFGFTQSIAIEANPRLIPFLRMNHRGPVHHAAVYSESGGTIGFVGDGAIGQVGGSGIPVPKIALRDLEVEGPVLVKLDIEGAEIPAIEGLGNRDAILVYEDFPRLRMKVTRYLLDSGWRVFTDRMEAVTCVEQVSASVGKKVPRNLVAMR